jgi:hypothetical protein
VLLTVLSCEYSASQPFGHGIATTGAKLPPEG